MGIESNYPMATKEEWVKIWRESYKFFKMDFDAFMKHVGHKQYGDFLLTDGIVAEVDFQPIAGYRHNTHRLPGTKEEIPYICANVSREKLLGLLNEVMS